MSGPPLCRDALVASPLLLWTLLRRSTGAKGPLAPRILPALARHLRNAGSASSNDIGKQNAAATGHEAVRGGRAILRQVDGAVAVLPVILAEVSG